MNLSTRIARTLFERALIVLFLGLSVAGQAAAQAYTDSFDNPTINPFWNTTQQYGTVSLSGDQAHSGSQSVKFSSSSGGQREMHLSHNFASPTKGNFSVYFYDVAPGQETLYEKIYLYNSNTTDIAWVGTQDFDATCYTASLYNYTTNVQQGPNGTCGIYPQTSTTNVSRTSGWHKLEINVSVSNVSFLIDGTPVFSAAGDYNFNSVDIAVSGPSFRPDTTAYFDDFSFSSSADQNWIQLTPAGGPPAARGFHGMSTVYDPASNQMMVFGGRLSNNSNSNDLWVLTNANGLGGTGQWTNLIPDGSPSSPPSRSGHSAVYDPATNRMIIFGGCSGYCSPALNDLWVLTNANGLGGTPTWIQLFPAGGPPSPRTKHTAVYDSSTNRMIVFAGQNGGGFGCSTFSEVWVLSNANGLGGTPTWTQISPTGGPPSGQYAPSAVYDPASNRMTVFGGGGFVNSACQNSNAVWVLTNANGLGGTPSWMNLVTEGASGSPVGRGFHSAVYDAANNQMTIFGGDDSLGNNLNDAWTLLNANGIGGTAIWTQIAPTGAPPSARNSHGAVFDPATRAMTIFGGDDQNGFFNDTWVLTNATGMVVPTPTPSPTATPTPSPTATPTPSPTATPTPSPTATPTPSPTPTPTPAPPENIYVTANNNTVSAIDSTTFNVVATYSVPGLPDYDMKVTPDGKEIYVTLPSEGTVAVIDTSTNSVITLPINANAVAISPDGSRAYLTVSNSIAVLRTDTHTVVATIPLSGQAGEIILSPDGMHAYVDGTAGVFVVDALTNAQIATIPGVPGGDLRKMAVTPNGRYLYVAGTSASAVFVIDTTSNMLVAQIPDSNSPVTVAITPDGMRAYIGNGCCTGAWVLDTTTNMVIGTIGPSGHQEIAVSHDGTRAYISNIFDAVYVVDTTSNTILSHFTVSGGNAEIAVGAPVSTPTPKAATSTTVVSSLNPSVSGQLITFTATVSSSTVPSGNVQFFDGSSLLGTVGLTGSSAALSTSSLSPGTHSITTIYGGDANSQSSTSPALSQIVYPVLSSVTLTPKSVVGANSTTGSILLTGPAPPGGITVTLSGDNAVATVPQNVAIPEGSDTAAFTVTTTEVTANTPVHLTATWNGTIKKVTLTVLPFALKSLSVTPASVTGGASATGKVTLNGAAPAGGKLVVLASDNTVAAVPENVTVTEGASTATFTITTSTVDSDTLTNLSATFGGVTKTTVLTVKEPIVKSVKLSPASVVGGEPSTGTVTLSGPAPSGGTAVSLTSSDVAVGLPTSLVMAEGTTVATFPITTIPVASDVAVSIIGMAEDTAPRTVTLTVKAPAPTSLSFSPASVIGGAGSTGTVKLSGIAPVGGIAITLLSADGAVVVPPTIIIAEGQSTTTFSVTTTPVPANRVASVSASHGTVTKTANLTVKAPTPTSLSLTSAIVTGGTSSTANLTLTGPAPTGGLEVTLSSTNAATILPPSVTVAAGESMITFNVGTSPVAVQTSGTVSATSNGVTRSDSLTIKVPVPSSVSLTPAQVGGGAALVGTVTLTGPAPAGSVVVQLTSSKTAIASVPSSVNVAAGETTAVFTVTTSAVTAPQTVTISATLNGVKKSATLTVAPIALGAVSAAPTSIRAGDSTVITVTLNGPAPSGGFAIALSSSAPTVVNVPTGITIAGGASSVTINVTAAAPGTTSLTGSANGVSYVAVITASP